MMTKIDAMREAMACNGLSAEAREAIRMAVEKYDRDRADNQEKAFNEKRRREVLNFMEVGVPMTAKMISDIAKDAKELKFVSFYWNDEFTPSSVAGLLREAIKRGDVVIDHKEKTTITISPWGKPDFEKEVMVSFYCRVR